MDENTFFTKDGNLKEKIEIPDYFILFNLQKKYSLDAKELEQSFEDWMLQLHPDLFATALNSQKTLSLKYSAILKQAKDILSNPFQRAKSFSARDCIFSEICFFKQFRFVFFFKF